jgi:ribonuclease HI
MELMAAIQALGNLPRPCAVRILSDSQYLIKGITQWWPKWEKKGWRRKHGPIPNTDLWKQLIAETARHDVEWQWVKGHAGNLGNECADVLATAGRLRAMGETVEVTAQMFYDRHGPDLAHRLAGSP